MSVDNLSPAQEANTMQSEEQIKLARDEKVNGRNIYEVANQLGGFIGPGMDKFLRDFLSREAEAANDLAEEIVSLRLALRAALSTDAEPVAEIVGQQGRYWMQNEGRWSNWVGITFNTWVPETGVREVRNVYAAPPPPSVAVKALEWHDRHDIPLRANDLLAESVVGQYAIRPSSTGKRFRLWMPGMDYNNAGVHFTVESAKADAQADYEARIRSALSAQVQDVAEPLSWESKTVGYIKYVTNSRYEKFRDEVKKWYKPICTTVPEGWHLVPKVSTAEMEDAARHLMMWLDFTRPTEASLLAHCKRLGKEPPPECKDVGHVPSKATRLFWVYRAMLSAAPAAKQGEGE